MPGPIDFQASGAQAQALDFQPEPPAATPGILESFNPAGLATFAGMKAAPGIVAGLHKTAPLVSAAAQSAPASWGMAGATTHAMVEAAKGNYKNAGWSLAGAAALSQVPNAMKLLQRLTHPLSGVMPSGARFNLKPGVTGSLTRGAGLLSRMAGPAGLIVSAATMDPLLGSRDHPLTRQRPPVGRGHQLANK